MDLSEMYKSLERMKMNVGCRGKNVLPEGVSARWLVDQPNQLILVASWCRPPPRRPRNAASSGVSPRRRRGAPCPWSPLRANAACSTNVRTVSCETSRLLPPLQF